MKKDKLLTLESAKRIYNNLGLNIEQSAKELDFMHALKLALPKNEESISDILSLHMHVLYLIMDLSVVYRMYLFALIPHEERFAIQQLNVIMVEGYKRLYGFNTHIKDSFFYKINPISNTITSTDCDGYKIVEQKLIDLGNSSNLDKDARDISVHYDPDVLKVYDMLVAIDAEETSKKVVSCLAVLNSLTSYLKSVEKRFFSKYMNSLFTSLMKIYKIQ